MKRRKTNPGMRWVTVIGTAIVMIAVYGPIQNAQACSRILYETGSGANSPWTRAET